MKRAPPPKVVWVAYFDNQQLGCTGEEFFVMASVSRKDARYDAKMFSEVEEHGRVFRYVLAPERKTRKAPRGGKKSR